MLRKVLCQIAVGLMGAVVLLAVPSSAGAAALGDATSSNAAGMPGVAKVVIVAAIVITLASGVISILILVRGRRKRTTP